MFLEGETMVKSGKDDLVKSKKENNTLKKTLNKKEDKNIENKNQKQKKALNNVDNKKSNKKNNSKNEKIDKISKSKNNKPRKNNEKDIEKVSRSNKKEEVLNKNIDNLESKINNNNLSGKKECVKNKKKNRYIFKRFDFGILDILLLIVVTMVVSCLGTAFIFNYQYNKNDSLSKYSLKSDENITEFLKVYADILENYYQEIDSNALIDAAIDGMLDFLEDEYSIYLGIEETDDLYESLSGSYEGIGVATIGAEIVNIYEDSPAAEVGLQVGDIIYKVDDVIIDETNVGDLTELFLSKKDKVISLVVKRDNEEIECSLSFGKVILPVVSSEYFKYDKASIGYLKISSFSSTSYEQFQEKLIDLEKNSLDSLIIDLRDNGGGYLNSVTDIASVFLKKGDIIYSLEKKDKVESYKDKTEEHREYSVVVLVNQNTASAAEILASSLKENYGAILVGNTTFGKGTVQNTQNLSDGTMLKYTSAKWLTPTGDCINEKGIVPDYEIDISYENDTQLEKAIQLLK